VILRGEPQLVDDAPLMQGHVHAVYPLGDAGQKLIGLFIKLVSAAVPLAPEDADIV
jgi:hypothetical protein